MSLNLKLFEPEDIDDTNVKVVISGEEYIIGNKILEELKKRGCEITCIYKWISGYQVFIKKSGDGRDGRDGDNEEDEREEYGFGQSVEEAIDSALRVVVIEI